MKKNTYRIPIGFVAALVFLYRADPSAVSFALGLLVMIFGEALRFISAGTLVKFEGVTREGIYSYVRNPLYIGSFFIGLGACVLGRDMYITVFYLIAYPTVYYRIIKREENWLIGRYGDDYRAYLQETPRLLPRRFPRADLFYYSAPFLAVKNRELKTVAGILAVTIILGLKMLLF